MAMNSSEVMTQTRCVHCSLSYSTNVLTTIEANGYAATDKQIEQLAHIAVDGTRAGGTYLRILVACTQADAGTPKRAKRAPTIEATMAAFERTHTRLYGIVANAVAIPDDARESNRRTIFARSAASTLRAWLRAGGDISQLDARTVTKASLRPPKSAADSAAAAVERATSALAHRLDELSDETREATLDALAALIEEYRPRVVATALSRSRRVSQPAAH